MPTAIVLLDSVSLGHPLVPIFLFYGSPVLLLLFVIWLLRIAAERFRRMQKENDSRRVGEVIA